MGWLGRGSRPTAARGPQDGDQPHPQKHTPSVWRVLKHSTSQALAYPRHLGDLLKARILTQEACGGARESAFLTSPRLMPPPLAGDHARRSQADRRREARSSLQRKPAGSGGLHGLTEWGIKKGRKQPGMEINAGHHNLINV